MFTIYNVPDNTSSHINQAPYLTGDNSNNSERGVPKGGVHAQKSCLRKFLPSCVPRTRCICQKSARGTCWDGTFSRVPRTGPTLHSPLFSNNKLGRGGTFGSGISPISKKCHYIFRIWKRNFNLGVKCV